MSDLGITELSLPVGQLIVLMILAALIGVVAAILPARRAAKLNVLEAIRARRSFTFILTDLGALTRVRAPGANYPHFRGCSPNHAVCPWLVRSN